LAELEKNPYSKKSLELKVKMSKEQPVIDGTVDEYGRKIAKFFDGKNIVSYPLYFFDIKFVQTEQEEIFSLIETLSTKTITRKNEANIINRLHQLKIDDTGISFIGKYIANYYSRLSKDYSNLSETVAPNFRQYLEEIFDHSYVDALSKPQDNFNPKNITAKTIMDLKLDFKASNEKHSISQILAKK
jgi:hypothetical protein